MAETLNARELAIIEARFGFDGEKRTLEALGKEHSRCREQIRIIEAKALRKLKGGRHRRRLYDALEVLGGHPRPSLRPGSREWNESELKDAYRFEAARLARAQAKRHARIEPCPNRQPVMEWPSALLAQATVDKYKFLIDQWFE